MMVVPRERNAAKSAAVRHTHTDTPPGMHLGPIFSPSRRRQAGPLRAFPTQGRRGVSSVAGAPQNVGRRGRRKRNKARRAAGRRARSGGGASRLEGFGMSFSQRWRYSRPRCDARARAVYHSLFLPPRLPYRPPSGFPSRGLQASRRRLPRAGDVGEGGAPVGEGAPSGATGGVGEGAFGDVAAGGAGSEGRPGDRLRPRASDVTCSESSASATLTKNAMEASSSLASGCASRTMTASKMPPATRVCSSSNFASARAAAASNSPQGSAIARGHAGVAPERPAKKKKQRLRKAAWHAR